ncbi:MAG TPA: DUF835 domain-containing protein [Candidatus Poseidoniales archaeon]|nr:MAG TPA: DUF835 domain-containing protein [Candidatus Poseidoniales archaeon]HII57578.1 hypothetical protein [Candidatus Poseidoniaceae archaeon]
MLQVGGNRAYLYQTQTYSQLFSDLEHMIEKNPETRFTLITRIPSRRLLEQLDLNVLDTYWVTEQDTNDSIKPDFTSIYKILNQNKDASKEQVMVIEGLEFIADRIGPDALLSEITRLVDDLSMFNYTCILCLDLLAMPAKIATKLKYTLESLEFSDEHILVTEYEEEHIEPSITPGEHMEYELGKDGNPRLVYLSKLPRLGFSNNILVKRILQWRRMGLDVSEIEPALKYQEDKAYELYKLVEEKVRRAVDLDRFINSNSSSISASDLATDIFRLRQLTGLEELERKYYKSTD